MTTTTRLRFVIVGAAVVLVVAISAVAAWAISANRLPPTAEPTPVATVTDTAAPVDPNREPVEHVEPEAGGDAGHDHDHSAESDLLSGTDQASIDAWLTSAMREWVTFDSTEPAEHRAARLEPYFTAEQIAVDPLLARSDLGISNSGYKATVTVHDVTYPALIAPPEDETGLMTEACYKTVVDYTANWTTGSSNDATRFGDNYWAICVPVGFSSGAMALSGKATSVEEPDIDFTV